MITVVRPIWISIIIFLFCNVFSFAQNPKNRIIIWDVTASMVGSTNNIPPNFGHNPNTDIDEEVRLGIIKIIEDSPDDDGNFRIMSFGSDIIDNRVFANNISGKAGAVKYIQDYVIEKKPQGYTNICNAWEKAMSHISSKDETVIYLFTDGVQNVAFGTHGTNCLPALIQQYCNETRDTRNFMFFISLNLPDNTFSNSLNNACPNNLAYMPVQNVRDGLSTPMLLKAMWEEITINLQDPGLTTTARFRIIDGTLPEGLSVKAQLEIDLQYHFDIISSIVKIEKDKVDVQFALEEVDGTTSILKTKSDLEINGIIKLSSDYKNIHFEPTRLKLKIVNKKPQKLHFNIQ